MITKRVKYLRQGERFRWMGRSFKVDHITASEVVFRYDGTRKQMHCIAGAFGIRSQARIELIEKPENGPYETN